MNFVSQEPADVPGGGSFWNGCFCPAERPGNQPFEVHRKVVMKTIGNQSEEYEASRDFLRRGRSRTFFASLPAPPAS